MIASLPTRILLARLNSIADSAIINESTIIAVNEAIEFIKDADAIAHIFNSDLSDVDKLKAIEKVMFTNDRSDDNVDR